MTINRENVIWKPVTGYEGLYEVSNMGVIKSLNFRRTGEEKILSTSKDTSGYYFVTLFNKGSRKECRVHRLVAEAFIPNPEYKPCIDHINTDRTDNRVENLKWVTHKENSNNQLTKNKIIKSHQDPILKKKRSQNISKSKMKPVIQFSQDGQIITVYNSVKNATEITGIDKASISYCCNGIQKTAGGYKWEYMKNNDVNYTNLIDH